MAGVEGLSSVTKFEALPMLVLDCRSKYSHGSSSVHLTLAYNEMNSRNESAGKVQTIYFSMKISAEKYKAYYQGQVQYIQVQSYDGRSVRFPANAIRQFLTAEGVSGDFQIQFDENNKLIGVSRR